MSCPSWSVRSVGWGFRVVFIGGLFHIFRFQYTLLASGDAGYVYLFKQVSRVRVDERGTEAGAVTVAVLKQLGVVMQVDRPFLFVIADRSSGAILFMGIVRQPAG